MKEEPFTTELEALQVRINKECKAAADDCKEKNKTAYTDKTNKLQILRDNAKAVQEQAEQLYTQELALHYVDDVRERLDLSRRHESANDVRKALLQKHVRLLEKALRTQRTTNATATDTKLEELRGKEELEQARLETKYEIDEIITDGFIIPVHPGDPEHLGDDHGIFHIKYIGSGEQHYGATGHKPSVLMQENINEQRYQPHSASARQEYPKLFVNNTKVATYDYNEELRVVMITNKLEPSDNGRAKIIFIEFLDEKTLRTFMRHRQLQKALPKRERSRQYLVTRLNKQKSLIAPQLASANPPPTTSSGSSKRKDLPDAAHSEHDPKVTKLDTSTDDTQVNNGKSATVPKDKDADGEAAGRAVNQEVNATNPEGADQGAGPTSQSGTRPLGQHQNRPRYDAFSRPPKDEGDIFGDTLASLMYN